MRPKHSLRRPTRWTAAEWEKVEKAAGERGVPPLRFVREIALEAAVRDLSGARDGARDRPSRRRPTGGTQTRNMRDLLARARSELAPRLRAAQSWIEVHAHVYARGFSLHEKGSGLVIRYGDQDLPISQVEPSASRRRLEHRLGSYRVYAESPFKIGRQRPGYRDAARSFARQVRTLFVDPSAARRTFLYVAAHFDPGYAANALRQNPKRFGRLKAGIQPDRLLAAALAGYAYASQRSPVRGVLRASAKLLREADEAAAKAAHLRLIERSLRDWRSELNAVIRRRRDAREIVSRFTGSSMDVFVDPHRALRHLYRHHRTGGLTATLQAFSAEPAQFGALTRSVIELNVPWMTRPLFRLTSYKRARGEAGALTEALREAVIAFEDRPTLAAVHAALEGVRCLEAEYGILIDAGYEHVAGEAESLVMEAAMLLGPLHRGEHSIQDRVARQLAPMLSPSASHLGHRALRMCFAWRGY